MKQLSNKWTSMQRSIIPAWITKRPTEISS